MSWYRTYRPTRIDGLHLTGVRTQLQDLLVRGNFPHALLFAGPRGTGKTSAARIISAVLNDPANRAAAEYLFSGVSTDKKSKNTSLAEPNLADDLVARIFRGNSMVVRELDAASNRGIDDMRALKEQIYLPPQEGLVTTYILDEVHMLTIEAFNALLKLLEEPPPQVLFILATTERHKIPETIVSRCTVIQFQRASHAELQGALENILQQEKITVDPAVLETVIQRADGSFRDGVKLLETVAAGKKHVTAAEADLLLPQVAEAEVWRFLSGVVEKNERDVIAVLDERRTRGSDPAAFFTAMIRALYREWHLLIMGSGSSPTHFSLPITQYLLQQFMSLTPAKQPVIPYLEVELKALELIFKSRDKKKPDDSGNSNAGSAPQHSSSTSSRSSSNGGSHVMAIAVAEDSVVPEVAPVLTTELVEALPTRAPQLSDSELADGDELIARWEEFLLAVHERNSSIEALLRSAKPIGGAPGRAQVEVYYQFHREQLEQPKFLRMLEEAVMAVLGKRIEFEFSLAKVAQAGAAFSDVSGSVPDEHFAQLAQELLV